MRVLASLHRIGAMDTIPLVFHRHVRPPTPRDSTGDLSSDRADRLQHFLRRFGPRFESDLWGRCPPTRSPHAGALQRFWRFFRARPRARSCLSHLLAECFPDAARVGGGNLPRYLILLELLLVGAEYDRCIALAETLSARFSADLRVQDIRARALILRDDDAELATNLEYGWKPFARQFCPSPFDSLAFFERDAYVCCVNYIPTSIGSIGADSVETLWDGAVAQDIRGAILDGSYRYCNKMVCPRLRNRDLPLRTEPTLAPYYQSIIARGITSSPGCYPRSIELNEDPSCNLVCPSCRGSPVHRDTDVLRHFEQHVLPGVLANPLNSFLVACYGEPLASSHYLRVLRSLDPRRHTIGEFVLYTNGVLFTPAQWAKLSNLPDYPIEVRISIDAATAATYAKVRPTIGGPGDFRALLANLEFASELRRSGRIRVLKLMFVVQHDNFDEMPAFAAMGKWLGADEVVFAEMQKFGRYFDNDLLYARKAVHLADHPDHNAYRAVLAHPGLREPFVSFHGCRLGPTNAGAGGTPPADLVLHDPLAASRGHPIASPATGGAMNEPWRGDALARTMAKSVSIPGDGEYHLVMSLPLNKHATRSNWFYTAQLTFQQGTEGTFGAHFQVRVRDAQGRSIMTPVITGQVLHTPNAYYNATLCDTVQDNTTLLPPPAGDYTFELHALSGGGTLLIVGAMTTISVLEIPEPQGGPGGR